MSAPEISVVVPSKDRPLRLRWLLNALEEQSLAAERWEVVVAHDSHGPETEDLLRTHPLARQGRLRHVTLEPTPWSAGKLRNAAWRKASAPVIAFTDDDCRPPREWLERALAAAERNPGAIVQGATRPDPDERVECRGAYHHSQQITPPTPYAEACNIVYPRSVLESVGGFVEEPALSSGEDTDLAMRARNAGAGYVGAPDVVSYHAVEGVALYRVLRSVWRWGDLAWLVKRHPELRGAFPLWIFWKRTHVWLPLAFAGAILSRRSLGWLTLAVPWAIHSVPGYGSDVRGRLREISEVPGRFLHDSTEFAALVRGSIKHRSLFL